MSTQHSHQTNPARHLRQPITPPAFLADTPTALQQLQLTRYDQPLGVSTGGRLAWRAPRNLELVALVAGIMAETGLRPDQPFSLTQLRTLTSRVGARVSHPGMKDTDLRQNLVAFMATCRRMISAAEQDTDRRPKWRRLLDAQRQGRISHEPLAAPVEPRFVFRFR